MFRITEVLSKEISALKERLTAVEKGQELVDTKFQFAVSKAQSDMEAQRLRDEIAELKSGNKPIRKIDLSKLPPED